MVNSQAVAGIAATALLSSAQAAESATNLVTINSDLAVQVCSPTTVRVVRSPAGTSVSQAVAGKESLMVKPGFCADDFSDYTVTKGSSGAVTSVSTSELHLGVGSAPGFELSFASKEGDAILNELSSSFVATKDPAQPSVKTFKVQQAWSVDEDEGLFGVRFG